MVSAMKNGESAIRNMQAEWQASVPDLECWVGAPLKEIFNIKDIPRTYRRSMGLTAQMAYVAAKESLDAAGVTDDMRKSGRMGVAYGSTTGSVQALSNLFEAYFQKGSFKNIGS